MTKKKNKLLTFCFSLIPGAGEMYMGFMKLGFSMMAIFFFIIALSNSFYVPFLGCFIPLIWFYSFFNVHNMNSMPDEDFYALEDHFLITNNQTLMEQFSWIPKQRKILSYTLIFFGISLFWNMITNFIRYIYIEFFPDLAYSLIIQLTEAVPQTVIAIALIFIGYKLLKDKKDSLKNEQK